MYAHHVASGESVRAIHHDAQALRAQHVQRAVYLQQRTHQVDAHETTIPAHETLLVLPIVSLRAGSDNSACGIVFFDFLLFVN